MTNDVKDVKLVPGEIYSVHYVTASSSSSHAVTSLGREHAEPAARSLPVNAALPQ